MPRVLSHPRVHRFSDYDNDNDNDNDKSLLAISRSAAGVASVPLDSYSAVAAAQLV